MKLLLIRHGETVDNVAQLLAGTRDSPLTVHGTLQVERLGKYLAENGYNFTHIFSSNLQRACKTANAIQKALIETTSDEGSESQDVKVLEVLREKDFGSYEGKSWNSRAEGSVTSNEQTHYAQTLNDPEFKGMESGESMIGRMNSFLHEHLVPALQASSSDEDSSIAVVSHGIVLGHLWRCLLKVLPPPSVAVDRDVPVKHATGRPLEHIGSWSNTGYLEVEIRRTDYGHEDQPESNSPTKSPSTADESNLPLAGYHASIISVNTKVHLQGLKRIRNIGSSQHDEKQKTLESFFKKRRV